eukprot:gene852-807_t
MSKYEQQLRRERDQFASRTAQDSKARICSRKIRVTYDEKKLPIRTQHEIENTNLLNRNKNDSADHGKLECVEIAGPPKKPEEPACIFCALLKNPPPRFKISAENKTCVAFPDNFPVSTNHTLVVTKRHVEDYWDATEEEKADIWKMVDDVKHMIDKRTFPRPHGYNVGFNAGKAAGQTVFHLHVHVIPRYSDDTDDAVGGVRKVIEGKANWTTQVRPPHARPDLRGRL